MLHLLILLTAITAPLTPISVDVTGEVRDAWRRPVHIDSVERWIVSRDAQAPKWTPVEPDDDGRVSIPHNAWARFIFESDTRTPALLDASAFSEAWINGLPRGGDLYAFGDTRLPFMLEAGRNEVLLQSGRGQPAPVVHTADMLRRIGAPRTAMLGGRDRTMPDTISGRPLDEWGAVLVWNIEPTPLRDAVITATIGDQSVSTAVPPIPPLSFLKVPVQLRASASNSNALDVSLSLRGPSGTVLADDAFTLRVREDTQWRKHTFRSNIDGSVQYYGLVPAVGEYDGPVGTVLSLHGASVKASGQANCYQTRPWCIVAAPTNRRPYGFDWEEWGRLDALEAMADAQQRYDVDPAHTWLTGHSMGGHGTWNIGLTVPDRFAAIAPSAGWRSFWTHVGPDRYPADGGVRGILRRAANPSDTELLLANASGLGVYILHGDADTVVPVSEARAMRAHLGQSHTDFVYFEKPKAGHWWGNECVDWPPLFDFLKRHTRETDDQRDRLRFVTVDPGASSRRDWVEIVQQERCLEPSSVDLHIDRTDDGVTITGDTTNITRLKIDTSHIDIASASPVQFVLDECVPITGTCGVTHLRRLPDGEWILAAPAPSGEKSPTRSGRLRGAWNHKVQLVVGTQGADGETCWNRARARQDAERWWYRGNGLVEIIDDVDFDPSLEPDRGLMLYGNADTNAAWETLLSGSPIQVHRDHVQVGHRRIVGPVTVAFVQPRVGSDIACVGVVGGTQGQGDRLAATLGLIYPGVGWPDWIVLRPESLNTAEDGIIGCGFLDNQWKLDPDQSAWKYSK